MCPVEPRRKRSAPWAAQGREEQRRIVRQHSQQFFPESTLLALEMRAKGVESLPREKKIEIIKANLPAIAGEIARLRKLRPQYVQRTMASRLPQADDQTIDLAAKIWMMRKIEDEKRDAFGRVEKIVRSYFKARRIPIDSGDFIAAINYYMRDENLDKLAHGIYLKEIEKTYIEFRKISRWSNAQDAEIINRYLRRITAGLKFTGNQKKHIKRWLKKEIPRHSTRRKALFALHGFNEAARRAQEMDKTFISQARENFSKQFAPTKKKTETGHENLGAAPSKIGTREQRLVEYAPRQREDDANTRESELKRTEEYSKQANMPFKPVDYCITEITKENEPAGTTIKKLYTEGKLNSSSIVSLFTSGSLTQRTFLGIIEKTGFIQRFGAHQINPLARGLSFIGPKGKLITRAKRALQTPRREEIFNFLERNGYLETHHGGGNVVYLKRT